MSAASWAGVSMEIQNVDTYAGTLDIYITVHIPDFHDIGAIVRYCIKTIFFGIDKNISVLFIGSSLCKQEQTAMDD